MPRPRRTSTPSRSSRPASRPSVLLAYLHAIEDAARPGAPRAVGRSHARPRPHRVRRRAQRRPAASPLPHPRAAERDFVLAPWLSLDPDAELPGVGRVDALLERLRAAAMKRTGAGILLVTAALGVAAGFLLDQVLTASGRPTFTPGGDAADPARAARRARRRARDPDPPRDARRPRRAPVNPFRALRIAMLAKASSIVGAAIGGSRASGCSLFLRDPARHAVARLDGHDHRDGRVRGAPRRRGTRRRAPLHHPEGRR